MSRYTPTTEVVRDAVSFPRERLGEPRPIKPEAFDRWLSRVKFEAWKEGRSAGLQQFDIWHAEAVRALSEPWEKGQRAGLRMF